MSRWISKTPMVDDQNHKVVPPSYVCWFIIPLTSSIYHQQKPQLLEWCSLSYLGGHHYLWWYYHSHRIFVCDDRCPRITCRWTSCRRPWIVRSSWPRRPCRSDARCPLKRLKGATRGPRSTAGNMGEKPRKNHGFIWGTWYGLTWFIWFNKQRLAVDMVWDCLIMSNWGMIVVSHGV